MPLQANSLVNPHMPVTNPVLKEILRCKYEEPGKANIAVLEAAVLTAIYLVPILNDEMKVEANGPNGELTLQKGSRIKIMIAFDQNKVEFLPLFTDWEEVKKWTRGPVPTLVMPAKQAFGFVCATQQFQGAVINPAGQLLSIQRKGIELLAK